MSEPLPAIAVLADDLIWSSRLVAAVENAGARPVRESSVDGLGRGLASGDAGAAIVDLNGRAYHGLAAVEQAAATGRPVVAVGQHEDVELRRQAIAAGARQVYSYNRFYRE
jgi:DNA-binding NarL/FixJ family response regulator